MAVRLPRRRRSKRAIVLGLLGLAVLAWLAVTAVTLLRARRDAQAGIDKLDAAQAQLTPSGLVHGDGESLFRDAAADFERARHGVRSPLVAPLRILPVVGRQVRAVDGMTGAAARVVDIGVSAMDSARSELRRTQDAGPQRVATARDLSRIASGAARQLDRVDLGPGHALVSPLASARRRFEDQLTRLDDAVVRMRDATAGFADFLQGPTTYLVLAANNAEMRVGSGTFLSVGVLTVHDGRMSLGDMQSTRDYEVPAGAVPISGDLAARWGWLAPNREWRNLGSSPRFDTQARLAQRMWAARTGQHVDGVLALDPIALRALLATTGPVEVDGQQIDASNVVEEILYRQYLGLTGSYDEAQQARRDRLSTIAHAAVNQLDHGRWDAATLVDELRRAAEGRHVLAWSSQRSEMTGWRSAGVSGALPSDAFLLGVHNRGGNKLDYFLSVQARLAVEHRGRGLTQLAVLAVLKNTAPDGLPQYIQGPYPGARGAAPGLYQGLLVAEVPGLARNISMEVDGKRVAHLVAAGRDGPEWVVAAYVEVPRGATVTGVVHFELPSPVHEMLVEPSTRVPSVQWTFGAREWTDAAAERVHW